MNIKKAWWFLNGAGAADTAKVYIMAGQSNMSGVGDITGLDAQYLGALNPYIYSTYGSGTNTRNASTQSWQRLEVEVNNNNEGVNGVAYPDYMGPELVFGKKMSDLKPDRIFIIKYSIAGSDLTVSGGGNNWKVVTDTLFKTLTTDTLINGLNEIVSEFGLTPEIKGFIWMQGEADADNAGTTQAEYKNQMVRVIKNVADIVDGAGYDCSGMRVTVGRLHDNFSPARPRTTEVRAAQVDVATNFLTENVGYSRLVKGLTYVDSDGYGLNGDFIHFSQAGQISFGTDLYNYYSTYINEVTTPTYASTSGFDSDAATYVIAAKLTSAQQTIANAINSFIVTCKADGTYTKMAALYFASGGNKMAHKFNAKTPTDLDASYRLTFGLPLTHIDTGFQGDGTAASYVDTWLPFNALGQNTMGAFFTTVTDTQETRYMFGVTSAPSNLSRLTWSNRYTDGRSYPADASGEQTGAINAAATGAHIITRTAAGNFNTFIRGTKASFAVSSVAPDANTVILLGRNLQGVKSGSQGSTRVMSLMGLLNASLSDGEAANLKTAVDTYMTALGR